MSTFSIRNLSLCVILLICGAQSQTLFAQHALLSDDFEDPGSITNWQRFYQAEDWPDMMEHLSISDGMLVMMPHTSGWYADYHAPFLFKEVEGDFTVTSRLKILGRKGEVPTATWSLSGLMIRAPRDITKDTWTPNKENWLFLTTGFADDLDQPVFETKTTVNSRSRLQLHPNTLDWVELRVVRKGSFFTLFYRYESEEWTQIEQFNRPDLPETVQVGLNAYTDFYSAGRELMRDYMRYNTTIVTTGNADLKVLVDYVRFE